MLSHLSLSMHPSIFILPTLDHTFSHSPKSHFRTMGTFKIQTIFLSSFLLTLSISISISSSLEYQSFTLTSLPNPNSLSYPTQLSTPESDNPSTLSLNLHHIDTLSITRQSNATPSSLFHTRLTRDSTRVKSILARAEPNTNATSHAARDFSSSIVSGLSQGSGEYFTRLGIGTPPRYVYMVLDTGSDVVWVQCAPCSRCYKQSDPVFDPRKSSTFTGISCNSPLCNRLDSPGCNTRRGKCLYQVSYGDGSYTVGEFSTETLTFRRNKVPNIALGCGHDNEGLFVGAAGLLGLGKGKLSFPSQAGTRFGKKFSYCLVDRSSTGKPSSVIFGETSVSRNAVFTPMVKNPRLDTFYYVGLVGFSVGGARVKGISGNLFRLDKSGNGGVIVDSGTSVTRLTRPAYIALRDAFRAGASNLKGAGEFSLFDTCFDLSGKKEVKVPTVVMHFGGGADVSLPASNYLIPVDSDGKFCFAFAGTSGGLSIIGNIQQQGFRVVFDLAGNRVGFAPRGCV